MLHKLNASIQGFFNNLEPSSILPDLCNLEKNDQQSDWRVGRGAKNALLKKQWYASEFFLISLQHFPHFFFFTVSREKEVDC